MTLLVKLQKSRDVAGIHVLMKQLLEGASDDACHARLLTSATKELGPGCMPCLFPLSASEWIVCRIVIGIYPWCISQCVGIALASFVVLFGVVLWE